jgi:hypothetical protein
VPCVGVESFVTEGHMGRFLNFTGKKKKDLEIERKQEGQCIYNISLRYVCITIVTVEMQ